MQHSSKTCRRLQSPHIGINQMLTENYKSYQQQVLSVVTEEHILEECKQIKGNKYLQAAPARDSWDFTLINSKGKVS